MVQGASEGRCIGCFAHLIVMAEALDTKGVIRPGQKAMQYSVSASSGGGNSEL